MRKHIYYWLTFIILTSYSALPATASAQEVIFTDDFSGNLSNWQPIRDDGRYWKIINQELEGYIPFGYTLSELVPASSIWPSDVKNYTYEFDFTAIQGADKNISFGVIDKNNWYEIHFTPSLTEIARIKNGVAIWSKQTPYILPNGTTHHFSVAFVEGRIVITINNEVIFDTTDPTFENNFGTVGIKATTGSIYPTRIKIDNIVVKKVIVQPESQDTILGVELIKQNDPAWADLEYDTASYWASQFNNAGIGFKNWACNLISQLMILRFHGITTLTNGSELTPIRLNEWLLNNKGYHNSPSTGNINRHSISQLTALISKTYGTPKLEFTYVGSNLLETAIAEIEKGNPVILELDGHFVVADGFTADKKDLYIKDPAYTIEKLSDHHLALKSLRLYTPSQTDLSYITVASSDQIKVQFATEAGETLATNHYSEKLRFLPQEFNITGPETVITELPKPSEITYTINLINSADKSLPLNITVYTAEGVAQELLKSQIKPGSHTYQLEFKKNSSSTLTAKYHKGFSFQDLRKTIKQLSNSKAIKQVYFEKALLQLLASAEKQNTSTQIKLLKVIRIVISNAPKSIITSPAQALLLDQVKLLLAGLK